MKVKVKYFASLREHLGRAEEQLELEDGTSVQSLWRDIAGTEELGDSIMTAINQQYVHSETIVQDGDEVAFFPPVTGG